MFGDLAKMMKLAGEIKRRMPELQAKLAESTYDATSGGGAVRAVVNGKLSLVELSISPQVLADGDAGMIEDLVKAAISAAQEKASQSAAEAMRELTGGMDIPGLT
jgi:DNA-binding YbaB/EbfC family protein